MKRLFKQFLSIAVTICTLLGLFDALSWAATASCRSQQENKLDCMEFSGATLPAPLKQVCIMAGGAQWVNNACPKENVLGFCEVSRKDNIRQRAYCYRMAQMTDAQRIVFCRMGCNGTFSTTQGKPSVQAPAAVATSPASAKPKAGAGAAGNTAATHYAMELNMNRYGDDYKDLDLDSADPRLCAQACMKETKCKAWTYVKPGVQADNAKCWLKDKVPPATPDENCVSGVKKAGTSGGGTTTSDTTTDRRSYRMETNVNLPGEDYKDLDLPTADPALCAQACLKEAKCKAWTYVKPGVQADNAKCWLKDKVPLPTPDENCVSGDKTRRQ